MSFLEDIFARLGGPQDVRVLRQATGEAGEAALTGRELLQQVGKVRAFLRSKVLRKGDRCALLSPNNISWVAVDLAIMAEGLIVVPLYSRQAPAELVAMMKDCGPALICCGDAELRDGIVENWGEAPPQFVFDEMFAGAGGSTATVK